MIVDRYKGFEIRRSQGRYNARPTCATVEAALLAHLMECDAVLGMLGIDPHDHRQKTWTMWDHAGHKRPIIQAWPRDGHSVSWLRKQIDLYVELRERLRPHVRRLLRSLHEEAT